MDEVWQEIRTELLRQPEAKKAQRVAPYAPFVFRGEVYCKVEAGGCEECPFGKLKDDRRACHAAPACDTGHFDVFTPEHYARLVAQQWRDNDAGNTPAESN